MGRGERERDPRGPCSWMGTGCMGAGGRLHMCGLEERRENGVWGGGGGFTHVWVRMGGRRLFPGCAVRTYRGGVGGRELIEAARPCALA